MIELYEKGTADIKKKKNKTKEEIEVEKQMKECTFHPNIQIEDYFINDISGVNSLALPNSFLLLISYCFSVIVILIYSSSLKGFNAT